MYASKRLFDRLFRGSRAMIHFHMYEKYESKVVKARIEKLGGSCVTANWRGHLCERDGTGMSRVPE
jgi:hypothetical protein